jgi:hypothetical protein
MSSNQDSINKTKEECERIIQHIRNCGDGFFDKLPQPYGILFSELENKIVIDDSWGEFKETGIKAKNDALEKLKKSFNEKSDESQKPVGDTRIIKQYIGYLKQKSDLETQLKATKMHLDELQPGVLKYFSTTGLDQVKTDGMTLFPQCLVWAKYNDGYGTDNAAEHLKENGFPEFAKPKTNIQGLTSFLRECVAEEKSIPEAIAKVVHPTEVWKVGYKSS